MTSIECGLTEHLFMIRSIQGRFSMTDQAVRYFEPFDLDVTLRDAALDDQNRPTRRMLANAAIGMHVEDAYYSVRELREAVSWIHEGETGGKRKLASILSNPAGDDFQRCIYFCLAGRGVVEMIDRSEENTYELQSLMRISYAGFCLKKKNNTIRTITQPKNTHTANAN